MKTLALYPWLVLKTAALCLIEAALLKLNCHVLAADAGQAATEACGQLDALHLSLFPWEE